MDLITCVQNNHYSAFKTTIPKVYNRKQNKQSNNKKQKQNKKTATRKQQQQCSKSDLVLCLQARSVERMEAENRVSP